MPVFTNKEINNNKKQINYTSALSPNTKCPPKAEKSKKNQVENKESPVLNVSKLAIYKPAYKSAQKKMRACQ